jgi:hypothetical protein
MSKHDLDHIDKFASYYSFDRCKPDGEMRKITTPNDKLKKIQRRILDLLSPIIRPEWLIAGERGKSYIDNAKIHQYSNFFLTVDVRKFYDNCRREYVFRFFKDTMLMPADVAGAITDLVTREGGIPTVSPTSQIIAYYAYKDMFDEIHVRAKTFNCLFTLYVDDMTFSSSSSFDPRKLANQIDVILRKYGHKPKYRKVKYYSKNQNKVTTGVAITPLHHLTVPNRLRHAIIKNKRQLVRVEESQYACLLKKLHGQINAARRIETDAFAEINQRIL